MKIVRLFRKHLSLRVVNLVGLSIMFACLLLSAGYIKRELSYDQHHANADRMVRMTLQFDDKPVDGRIYGNALDAVLQQIPEIDRTVKMRNIYTAVLTYQGNHRVVNDFYQVNRDFLQVFDLRLLYGDKDEALQQKGQAIVSESFARQLFGELDFDEIQMSGISIGGRQIEETNVFIAGIFKDIPETSHFHTDIFLHLPDDMEGFMYTYLLLKKPTDINVLAQKITQVIGEKELYQPSKTRALLMPLTDIHLHSHNLREMSVNGNIQYIYLIVGANALLLTVVLFNLWLNASLIFSHNRRYYQIVRICGASSSEVFKDEALTALLLGIFSIIMGILATFCIITNFQFSIFNAQFSFVMCLIFLLSVVAVSLLPALKDISSTLFLNTNIDLKPVRFSYSNVRWMLTTQYAVVMIVVILAFGINKQMNLVKDTQVGGNERNILVMNEQPDPVQAKYELLKTELLKHTKIEAITTSFQLPGDAIRDLTGVRRDGDMDLKSININIVGEDFLPFFDIQLIAGRGFSPLKFDYQTEDAMFLERHTQQQFSEHIEEYVINRKALAVLGFNTPEEAVGEILYIEQGTVDYIRRGVIAGVTDDFNYTGLYEETIPLLILQRSLFLQCIMVRFAPGRFSQARDVFDMVWNEVIPDYSADYVFMNDMFARTYRNELNAQRLVYIFTLLCFIIADLGLIVFMAFIVRRRTREIGIRKVYGASIGDIIRMLNMDFIRYIALAFVIAAPVAYYVMHRWL